MYPGPLIGTLWPFIDLMGAWTLWAILLCLGYGGLSIGSQALSRASMLGRCC